MRAKDTTIGLPFSSRFTVSYAEVGTVILIFGLYILIAQLSRFLFYAAQTSPAVILTPVGFAVAALILYGYRLWPVLALAALTNALLLGALPSVAIITTIGTVFQALFGTYLLRKLKFDPTLTQLRDILALIVVTLVITPISPTFSTAARVISHTNAPAPWSLVWLGGVLSTIILTPLLVRWISYPQFKRIRTNLTETIVIFLLLIIVNVIVFWTPYAAPAGIPVAIFQLVLLTWIALRMGTARTTLAMFVTSVVGLTGPYLGTVATTAEALSKKIVGTELYLIIFAILFYIIAAISEERDMAAGHLKKNINNLTVLLQKIQTDDHKKDEFIAVLAHELRNPLAPIVYYLDIMELEGKKDPKLKEISDKIGQQVKNITRLLDDLLDISRITQGKIKLKKEKIDIRVAIEKSVESSQVLITGRKHNLIVNLPPEPFWVFADLVRLEQIIINLLNNAAKYTEPGGTIWLDYELREGDILIHVRDNGLGIRPEVLPEIFGMFNQGDSTITRSRGGLGIGLGLVKALVELHGGNISAKSAGVGQGSEFTLCLPPYQEPLSLNETDSGKTEKSSRQKLTGAKRRKRVLIVDDNEEILTTLVRLLTLAGYEVASAPDGPQALKEARRHAPDVALLDIGLPEMSGYELAERLRREVSKKITLIAISGYGQKEDKNKSQEVGFDYHLTKPVRLADIEEIIQNVD